MFFDVPLHQKSARTGCTSAKSKLSAFGLHCPCTVNQTNKVNGYELIVNEEGYMYFNVKSLLEGFMVHVGMKRLEEMTQEEINDFLKATKDGSLNKKLQAEVTALKEERKELKLQQREMKKEIENLKKELAK